MKFNHILALLLTIFLAGVTTILSAQPKSKRFGKVEEHLIRQENFDAYPEVPAVVLYDQGNRQIELMRDIRMVYARHTRIKILSEEAFGLAEIEIPFISEGNAETVAEIKAITHYVDESGKIISQKMERKESVFEEDVDGYVSLKKFTLPNVQVGCVIEYSYKIHTEDIIYPKAWYFQQIDIPTLYSEVSLDAPDGFNYSPRTLGEAVGMQQKTENFNSGNIKGLRYRYWSTNIPGLKEESYTPNLDNFRFRMLFELSNISIPGVAYQDFSRSWEQIAKSFYEGNSYKSTLSPPRNVKEIAAQLNLQNLSGPSEVISRVLRYLRSELDWNEIYGVYSYPDMSNILKNKKGNGAGINLLGIALLRQAGLNAKPVLISTRNRGMIQRFFPSRRQFNHVLIGIEADSSFMLFDAIARLGAMNMIPVQDLNGLGMMIGPKGMDWVKITPIHSQDCDITIFGKLNTEGELEAKLTMKDKGYQALQGRYEYFHKAEEDMADYFSSRLLSDESETDLSSYELLNQDTLSKPLISKCAILSSDFTQMSGDFLYFQPMTIGEVSEKSLPVGRQTISGRFHLSPQTDLSTHPATSRGL